MNPERSPHTPERTPERTEQAESSAELAERAKELERQGEKSAAEQPERIESARREIEKLPDETESAPKPQPKEAYSPYAKGHAKKSGYKQTLKHVQDQLPSKSSKTFSRFIHQPAVETISEVAGKTIFRPSITLGASLGALLGGSLVYFIARYYGFQVSGSEFLLFGVLGAAIGIALELLSFVIKKIFKRSNQP